MKSVLYRGQVMHERHAESRHSFHYPVNFYGFDLAEVESLSSHVSGFSARGRALISLREEDYLAGGDEPLADRVKAMLKNWSTAREPHRIVLITSARYFNYVFNPVSFFLLYDAEDVLFGMLTEVNNTFGDRHVYCCPSFQDHPTGEKTGTAEKAFHVSPFFDLDGRYEFRVRESDDSIAIDVDLFRQDKPALRATIEGRALPFTTKHLWATVARFPLTAFLTMPRIVWQAAKLRYFKKLNVHKRPEPGDPMTIKTRPDGRINQFCRNQVLNLFRKLSFGTLTVIDGDTEESFGTAGSGIQTSITVNSSSFYRRLVFDGDVGLAEAYMTGDVDFENCTDLIQLLIQNRDALGNGDQFSAKLRSACNALLHMGRGNTLVNSRKNIEAHYDLSNDFFSTFLDPTMSYSCGVYHHAEDSLETAQRNKMHALIQKAQLTPDCHVLEIGTGWGSLAIEMVRQTGCRVTSVTISSEQCKLAKERVVDAGLEDRIEVLLCDYRNIQGTYDRIVSVEMLEAVGHKYLPDYFSQCDRLLKPNGLLVVQVITIPEARYDRYKKRCDFIQKHIFPGGHLPSLKAMGDAVASHTELHIDSVENIGPHYAPTLAAWQKAFNEQKEVINGLGFDEVFFRKWNYYFSYCEAAFSTGTLNVLHIVWSNSCNPTLLNPTEAEALQLVTHSPTTPTPAFNPAV